MITLKINGIDVTVDEGTTVLEAAQWIRFSQSRPSATWRACLLTAPAGCASSRSARARALTLVTSCTYPAEQGLRVRTASARVVKARKMVLELLLCVLPAVEDDPGPRLGARSPHTAVPQEHEDCILCGLCVRMCKEQMEAKAIGFRGRGAPADHRHAVRLPSPNCRPCGGCMYVCPACQLRCTYTDPARGHLRRLRQPEPALPRERAVPDMMCYMMRLR